MLGSPNFMGQTQAQTAGMFTSPQQAIHNQTQFNQIGMSPKASPIGRGKGNQGYGNNTTPPAKMLKMDGDDSVGFPFTFMSH